MGGDPPRIVVVEFGDATPLEVPGRRFAAVAERPRVRLTPLAAVAPSGAPEDPPVLLFGVGIPGRQVGRQLYN